MPVKLPPKVKAQLEEANALWRSIGEGQATQPHEEWSHVLERKKRLENDYAAFFEYYLGHLATEETKDPLTGVVHKKRVPIASFHREAMAYLQAHPRSGRAVLEWARGHAKSIHLGVGFPLWEMCRGNLKYMLYIGPDEDKVKELVSALKMELENNERLVADYGVMYNYGQWEDDHFVTAGGVAFKCYTLQKPPRGSRQGKFRPDYILIDDVDNDQWVDNERIVATKFKFLLGSVYGSMDMGRGTYVMVGNRIGPKGLLAKMVQHAQDKGWYYSKVNALNEDGEPSWPEKYTREEVAALMNSMPYTSAQAEYMNNPIVSGSCFREADFKWQPVADWTEYQSIVLYGDPSYKASNVADYKAWTVLGQRRGSQVLELLDCFVRQCDVPTWIGWAYDWYYSLPTDVRPRVVSYYEATFQQGILQVTIDEVARLRGQVLPIIKDTDRKLNKQRRIEQLSGLVVLGSVQFNERLKERSDWETLRAQLVSFNPQNRRQVDDGPDCLEGGVMKLQHGTQALATGTYRMGGGRNKNRGI
jgi:hypothetical protein